MRKNYRKKIFSFLLICITLSSIIAYQEVGVALPTSPLSSNSINQSEFDTIDSFDVHPANRWIENDNDFTATVQDGLLNFSDVGDGSIDYYTITRDLRSLDGSIEVRYKFSSNDTSSNFDNKIDFLLYSPNLANSYFGFYNAYIRDDLFGLTYLRYYDVNGAYQTIDMNSDEDMTTDEWYILRIDYDILKSEVRTRLYFENDTKIFDYNLYDIGLTRPVILGSTDLAFRMSMHSFTSGQYVEGLFDYVKAPFKERDWVQTDTPVDSDYLQDSWNFAEVQDDIDENSNYTLTIPSLDSVAVSFSSEVDIPGNYELTPPEDVTTSYFRLYAVDYDDGELHEIIEVLSSRYGSFAAGIFAHVRVYVDDDVAASYAKTDFASTTDPKVEFTIELVNDRTVLNLKGRHWEDKLTENVFYDFLVTVDLSDITADFSQEFVLETSQHVAFVGDFNYKLSYDYLTIIERGEFLGKGVPLVPPGEIGGGLFGWLGSIFITIIRAFGIFLAPLFGWLGEIFQRIQGWLTSLGTFITNAIDQIQGWLTSLGTVITNAIDLIEGWLVTLGGVLTDAIDLIQGWLVTLGGVIEDAIGLIQGWVEAIITDFIAGAQEFIEAILLGLLNLLADVWNFITGSIFFLWDILGWPDLLAIIATGLVGIIEIIIGAPAFILSVINEWILPFAIIIICLYWLWVLFLSFAEEGFEPFSGFSNFFDRLTTVYNLTILGVGPLPIPIALFFIPMTYFLIVVPAGSIFAIW